MFVIQNLLLAVAEILSIAITAYIFIIIIAAVVSWIRLDPYHPVVRALRGITEPVLYRVRRLLPFVYVSGIDFSPIVIILLLKFIDIALVRSLAQFAARL